MIHGCKLIALFWSKKMSQIWDAAYDAIPASGVIVVTDEYIKLIKSSGFADMFCVCVAHRGL